MQALILATGETASLGPLTERVPAPMLPLLSRPVMAYTVEMLARAGYRNIEVSLHRMPSTIEAYFGTGSRWGVQLNYLLQPEALGSAGALKWAASQLRDTFVVMPGHALVDFDLAAALALHRSRGSMATVVVHEPGPGYPMRPVVVGRDGSVVRVSAAHVSCRADELPPLADTGVYILEPQVLDCIPPGVPFDCYADLLPLLQGAGGLNAYVTEGYWNALDDVAAYQQAQLAGLASATGFAGERRATDEPPLRYPSAHGRQVAPGIVVGRHAAIHPAARLAPPVYIGDDSRIEEGVELGPGAIIGPNVIVDEGATICNSTVLGQTYVGRLVKLDGRVVDRNLVIDAKSGESLLVVDPFLLNEASPEPIVSLLSRAVDCAGALLLLLLWSPAIAAIALALLLASPFAGIPGRILEHRPRVRWRRTGETAPAEKETYDLLYFRTRRDEAQPLIPGRWLERWQVERLPSLWNVLRGDLRLVGVKPLDPAEADQMVEEWQRRCYEQPPGFTGTWFVELPGQPDLTSTAVADAYYTATRTPLTDLLLLLRTAAALRREKPGE